MIGDNNQTIGEGRVVTVFGGSGFVGRYVVRALARDGWRVRVACRRPDLAFFFMPLGRVGQVMAVQANVRSPESIAAALRGASAVVNLVGILAETGAQKFSSVQAGGARTIAEAAKTAGIDNVVHISAIGAGPQSLSAYGRSKAEGEAAMLAAVPATVILRPSVIFGPEDDFFNPLRHHGALLSVRAHRRRRDKIPAGLCRRCRRRGGDRARRPRQAGRRL